MPSESASYSRCYAMGSKNCKNFAGQNSNFVTSSNHAKLFHPPGLVDVGQKSIAQQGEWLSPPNRQDSAEDMLGYENFTSADCTTGRRQPFPRTTHHVFEFLAIRCGFKQASESAVFQPVQAIEQSISGNRIPSMQLPPARSKAIILEAIVLLLLLTIRLKIATACVRSAGYDRSAEKTLSGGTSMS